MLEPMFEKCTPLVALPDRLKKTVRAVFELLRVNVNTPESPDSDAVGSLAVTLTEGGPLVTVMFVEANTRRPSGSVASASIQVAPSAFGTKTKLLPNAGSWSRASQTTCACERSNPLACTEAVTGRFIAA